VPEILLGTVFPHREGQQFILECHGSHVELLTAEAWIARVESESSPFELMDEAPIPEGDER